MGKFKKNSKMKKNAPNVLKFRGHYKTDSKIQGVNVKLALKIKRKSIKYMIVP